MAATSAKICLLIASVINLLPVVGVLSVGRLEQLYGLKISDPNLEILMRHRAVLFGAIGVMLAASVFETAWQTPAISAGLVSMASFVVLTLAVPGYSGAFRHIVIADVIGSAALVVALALLSSS